MLANANQKTEFPYLGYGIGLRAEHYSYILENLPQVDWFEIITENFLVPGGRPHYYLDRIREHYPIVMHGVSLSIGSCDPLNYEYLKQLKDLIDRIEPAWLSDHFCWTGVNGVNTHDLLPLPYTEETIRHVVPRIHAVQEFLGRPILFENPSSYIAFKGSEMPEWEFINRVCQQTGCLVLLDVNNVYVSAFNHRFSAEEYIRNIPIGVVKQLHIAGHKNYKRYIIDTHDQPVIEQVWDLYAKVISRFGQISTLLERDDNIPPFEKMLEELNRARLVAGAVKRLNAAV